MNTLKKQARLAGLLYLAMTVFGIFAEFFVRTKMIVPGDAGLTAAHIKAHESLFRMGLVSDVICQVAHLFVVLLLYRMFKPIHSQAALVMLACVLVSVPITFLNLVHQHAVLLLVNNEAYMKVFTPSQLNALALLFAQVHKYGYSIAGVFFGLWLYPLGYLIYNSKQMPRLIGVLLMIGCFGYLADFLTTFLFVQGKFVSNALLGVAVVAELSICFWLLFKEMKEPTTLSVEQ